MDRNPYQNEKKYRVGTRPLLLLPVLKKREIFICSWSLHYCTLCHETDLNLLIPLLQMAFIVSI